MNLVRVMVDDKAPQTPAGQVPLVKVALPSGKVGFVSADALSPLGNDQICYVKDASRLEDHRLVGAGPGPAIRRSTEAIRDTCADCGGAHGPAAIACDTSLWP